MLEQECEITLNNAMENYNKELKSYFGNRDEPFDTEELFVVLKDTRDHAIDDFVVSTDVRNKFPNYEDFLKRLQDFMNTREDKIIEINETLAEECPHQPEPQTRRRPREQVLPPGARRQERRRRPPALRRDPRRLRAGVHRRRPRQQLAAAAVRAAEGPERGGLRPDAGAGGVS